jgi:hypothetical protein
VYCQEDDAYVLRLENLDIFNGPDLYIYAVAANDANDNDTVLEARFLNFERLREPRTIRFMSSRPTSIPQRISRSRYSVNGSLSTSLPRNFDRNQG